MLPPEATEECKRLGAEFLDLMTRACRASRTGVPAFLPLAVTTITFVGSFDRDVPVEQVRRAGAADPGLAASVGLTMDAAVSSRKRKAPAARQSFTNQVTFRPDGAIRGKSGKLFHNGTVHVTGCTSAIDFLEFVHAIGVFLHVAVGTAVRLVKFGIMMVNAGAVVVDASRTPLRFNPRDLCAAAAEAGHVVDFEPERHPGVRIVLRHAGERAATVYVFQTGNVSIIGARTPARMAEAFELVAVVLRACAHVASPCSRCKTLSKKPLVLKHGYPLNSWSMCLT